VASCLVPPLEKCELARRNYYVGGTEQSIGPPFLRGTSQDGPRRVGPDASSRLRQPHQTASRSTARPRRLQADDRRVFCHLFQPPVLRRGAGSRSRQGGDPLHRARHPRSKGASGRRSYRQGGDLQNYLHPPHIWGQDRRGAELGNGRLKTDGTASRARDTRARASRAGATSSAAHPASLAPQGGARTGGLADRSLLPARTGGGRRLLRLPSPFRGSVGAGGRGRHRQGRARSVGDGYHLRHVAGRRCSLGLLFAWRST
jgi:hypothetical protein